MTALQRILGPLALGAWLVLAGCASTRHAPPVADVLIGPQLPSAAPADSAASDSTLAAAPADSSAATVPPSAKASTAGKDASPPKETATSSSTVTPPEPKISAQQEVGVELDAAKKADLDAQTHKDLEEAERLVRSLASGTLTTERRDRIATVDSLITSSRAALDSDLEAAAALARKARLLAEEIARS